MYIYICIYTYTVGDALNHAPQCIQPAEPLLPGFPVLSRFGLLNAASQLP